jgi:hypothetical protein
LRIDQDSGTVAPQKSVKKHLFVSCVSFSAQ